MEFDKLKCKVCGFEIIKKFKPKKLKQFEKLIEYLYCPICENRLERHCSIEFIVSYSFSANVDVIYNDMPINIQAKKLLNDEIQDDYNVYGEHVLNKHM